MTGTEVLLIAELVAMVTKTAHDLINNDGDEEVPTDERAILKNEMQAAHDRFKDRVQIAKDRIAARERGVS